MRIKERIEERVEKLENELKEIKSELYKPKDQNIKRVKNQDYYYVSEDGRIILDHDDFHEFDDWRYSTGNYFLTEQEAYTYKKFLIIQGKVREIARRFPACDWSDKALNKYYICYSYDVKEVAMSYSNIFKYSQVIYCLSPDFLDICLSEIGKSDLEFYCKYEV